MAISSIDRTGEVLGLNNILRTPTFPSGVILMTVANRKSAQISKTRKNVSRDYIRTDPMNKFEASSEICLPMEDDIIKLVMGVSFEKMTQFYNVLCEHFGFDCSTFDCHPAVFLYNCHRYPEILHLWERILDEPDIQIYGAISRNCLHYEDFLYVLCRPGLFDTYRVL